MSDDTPEGAAALSAAASPPPDPPDPAPAPPTRSLRQRYAAPIAVAIAIGFAAWYGWSRYTADVLPDGIARGNGRIEAVEIDIATRTPGRLKEILVNESDFVNPGQVLAVMDTDQLEANRRQAVAQRERARVAIASARSVVAQREAERAANVAVVAQRKAQVSAVENRLLRSEELAKTGFVSKQALDDDRAAAQSARATVAAAQAQVAASDAAIAAAKAQVVDGESAEAAATAAIDAITADVADATLKAPRAGRVQYIIARPGEVLAGGGRVLNLVDLSDVYMTFFLPTAQAGRLALGAPVRIVLDAAPQYVIPAKVSFVADVAQFTPKTVETEEERQKLMFRVKAQIPPELLRKHIERVKTGLPGVAYVRIDEHAVWPAFLDTGLVQ
ncbi:MAG: HlyD family efflux transporter periplasmic adaptor subunit [Burkholderiales bacterium]|nr:HlyD family efflux transporter periplasmic adaptor subunit [Burkholderiales bacterium]